MKKWFLLLLAIALLFTLMRLGFWQLQRAEEKRQILTALNETMRAQPKEVLKIIPSMNAHNPTDASVNPYTRVTVSGKWLIEYSVLLDNQSYRGATGYEWWIPLQVEGTDQLLLVDGGWFPWDQQRHNFPAIQSRISQIQIPDNIKITGFLRMPSKAFVIGDNEENPGQWPRIVQSLDLAELQFSLPKRLLTHQVLQPEHPLPESAGEFRPWEPINMPPEKHTAYAVQWFGLAGTLFILLAILIWRNSRPKKS